MAMRSLADSENGAHETAAIVRVFQLRKDLTLQPIMAL